MTNAITLETKENARNAQPSSCYDYREPTWNRHHFLAFLGFAGGATTGLLGLLLTVVAWFGMGNAYGSLSFLGTLLVVAALPLLVFGAHALDKIDDIIDEHNRLEREIRCFDKQEKAEQ